MRLRFILLFVAIVTMGASCIQIGGSAVGPAGVFRSDDQGETWKPVVALPTVQGVKSIAGVRTYRLFPDPSDPNSWYLASRGNGLFYTYNNGETWQTADAFAGRFIYGVAVDSKDKCTIYVTDGAGLYKTTDCNRSWKNVYTEVRPSDRLVAVTVNPFNPAVLYLAKFSGDILKSSDGGASWAVLQRFETEIQELTASPLKSGRLYAATRAKGLFRSDDGGNNWWDMSGGLGGYAGSLQFYRLALHPQRPDSLFWISKYGILRSDDSGANWSDLKLISAPGTVNIYAFAVNPVNEKEIYYTATILGDKNQHVRSTFYKTLDGGQRWVTRKLPTNTIPASMYINRSRPGMLMLGFTIL